jgi:4-amino-4-deoxy-L-arabinose transferase-like glycosyltransferase
MYPQSDMVSHRKTKWFLFLGLSFLFLYGSQVLPLLGPDEPRYTQVARQMFESGDWITPRLGEHPWFEKPVLLYWLMSLSFALFGVNEFAARFPSVLAALFCVFLVYRIVKKVTGENRAFLCAMVLGTSAFIVGFAHAATFDMLLTVCVTASLFYFFEYFAIDQQPWKIYSAYTFCGLGILAKGFVAPAVICLAAGIYWLLQRGWRTKMHFLIGMLIVCGVAGIWLIPVTLIHGTRFWDDFFFQHHLQRYTTSQFHRSEGFLFYFPILALGMFPWTGAIFCSFRNKNEKLIQFCAIWLVSAFLFFSFSQSKLPGYILPVAAPYAVLAGLALIDAWENKKITRILLCVGIFHLVMAAALFWGINKFEVPHSPVYLMAVAIGMAALLSVLLLIYKKAVAAFVAQTLIPLSAILIAVHGVYPGTNWNETHMLAKAVEPELKNHNIAVFNIYDFSLVFYTNARVELDERGYFINLKNANDLFQYLSVRERGYIITSNEDLPWMERASFLRIVKVFPGKDRSIVVVKIKK